MASSKSKTIDKFFGGMVRDDKSKVAGGALNIEELDIFSNANYFQAEQVFTADALPASTEVYARTADSSDTVYAYGKETSGNKVRIVSVANGGGSNPGAFSTLFTSADTTYLAYSLSPIAWFKTSESGKTGGFLYYVVKDASNNCILKRYDITGAAESSTDSASASMPLSGLTGSYDRITFKVIFGELTITHGKYIAKVDKDGVFTQYAFTLPNESIAVDIIPVSDVCIILARNTNRLLNESKGYWWDLTATTQVDDSFTIPCGGPQWIFNHKETIKIMCAINGRARFYQMSGAFPGAVPIEIPGLSLENIASETSTQPISSSKMVATKDNILYFGVYKTDKTGIYAIGQLDSDKPTALILSKRYATTNYANHAPTSLYIQGPNFYGDFSDNGTASSVRCETLNSPDRSSNAIYESIQIDDGDPTVDKDLPGVYINTKPLAASTSVALSVASDYGSYSSYTRPDGTALNTASALQGYFKVGLAGKKVFQLKLALTSSGTSSPKVVSIGLDLINRGYQAKQ